ncbi:MAG TPA: hypothetical protein ENG92_04405 [Thiolapillus brandeum]|uniref:Uncharacterized protein n=1 Tax=Thiolapillus brandeum TaxID=1076588 RepID=A0A831KCD3_9GAMM|nr:hypothetical protein [Thiolapillus brandeum]
MKSGDRQGGATYIRKVCEADTPTCSNIMTRSSECFYTWNGVRLEVVASPAANQQLKQVSFSVGLASHFGHFLDHIYYRGLIPLSSRVTEVSSSDPHPLTVISKLDAEE